MCRLIHVQLKHLTNIVIVMTNELCSFCLPIHTCSNNSLSACTVYTYTCQVGRSAVWKTCCRPVSSRGSSNQVTATLRRLLGSVYKKNSHLLKTPLSLCVLHTQCCLTLQLPVPSHGCLLPASSPALR